jgi:hypothetical protein
MKRGFSEDFQPDTPTAAAKRRRGTRRTDSSGSGLKKVWYTTANVMEPFDEHVPLFTPLTVIVWIRSALKKRGVSLPQEWVTLGEMLPRHCFEGFRNVTPKTRPIKFAWEHVMAMTRSDPPLLNVRKPPISEKGKYKVSSDPEGLPLTKYAFQLTQYTLEHYIHSAIEYQKLKKIPLEFRDQKDWDKSMSSDEASLEEDYPLDDVSSANEATNNTEYSGDGGRDTKIRKSGQMKTTHRQLKEVYNRGDNEDVEEDKDLIVVDAPDTERKKQFSLNVTSLSTVSFRKSDKKQNTKNVEENNIVSSEGTNGKIQNPFVSEAASGVVTPTKLDSELPNFVISTVVDSLSEGHDNDVDIVNNFQKAQNALITSFEKKTVEIQILRDKVISFQKLLAEYKTKQQELLQELTSTQQRYKNLQFKFDELQNQSQEKIRALTKENESLRVQLLSSSSTPTAVTAAPEKLTTTPTSTTTTTTVQSTVTPPASTTMTTTLLPTPDEQPKNNNISANNDVFTQETTESRNDNSALMIDFFEPTAAITNVSSASVTSEDNVSIPLEEKTKSSVANDEVLFLANS